MMKNNVGFVLLALLAGALGIALVATRYQEMERQKTDAATIMDFSNQWTTANLKVEDLSQVNLALNNDLATNRATLAGLSNDLMAASQNVTNLGNSLAAAQSQVASQTARITDLQQRNKELNDRAVALATEDAELTNRINSLTGQIDSTRRELALSKTNNVWLEAQLQQLIASRAELEQKFESLTALRGQIKKLEDDVYTARRLRWMKGGTLDQVKGAQLLVDYRNGVMHTNSNKDDSMHVELGSDGSRVLSSGGSVTNSSGR